MDDSLELSAQDCALLADRGFFRAKAQLDRKLRRMLELVHVELRAECREAKLLTPEGFDPDKFQLVKGEHLVDCPYQYLDYPKYFQGETKFTFRTLIWWGHHVVFAWLLEGGHLTVYKRRLLARYQEVAGREVALGLAPSLWEWQRGEGYLFPLLPDRRAQVAAVLERRPTMKLVRVVLPDEPRFAAGQLPDLAREAFRAMLPVVERDSR